MNRSAVLNSAKQAVNHDRQADHGDMETNFQCIADLWSVYTGHDVNATQVGMMLGLVKVARQKSNPAHEDNYVDLAGYAANAGELATDVTVPSPKKHVGGVVNVKIPAHTFPFSAAEVVAPNRNKLPLAPHVRVPWVKENYDWPDSGHGDGPL